MARLDTRLESAGAEFLVLGNLLIEGIEAYKTYVNYPGFDIVAVNPGIGRACRIQVKSRWATDYDGGFPMKNFDCDFVVLAALNRGFRGRKKNQSDGKKSPIFYIFPVDIVRKAQNPTSSWGKCYLRHMEKPEQYQDAWYLIKKHMDQTP